MIDKSKHDIAQELKAITELMSMSDRELVESTENLHEALFRFIRQENSLGVIFLNGYDLMIEESMRRHKTRLEEVERQITEIKHIMDEKGI